MNLQLKYNGEEIEDVTPIMLMHMPLYDGNFLSTIAGFSIEMEEWGNRFPEPATFEGFVFEEGYANLYELGLHCMN